MSANSGARVLIVEDEDDMCWAMRLLVEMEGHTAHVAQSGRAALAALSDGPFDLAFVDLKLPDIDGLELAGRLLEQSPALHCVLVSGYLYADDETVQRGVRDGLIVGFIGKPFQLAQVRDALRVGLRSLAGIRERSPE